MTLFVSNNIPPLSVNVSHSPQLFKVDSMSSLPGSPQSLQQHTSYSTMTLVAPSSPTHHIAAVDPRCEDLNHVALGIYIGSHYVLSSAQPLLARGIRTVVNAAIEFITENPELVNWEDLQRNGIEVVNTMWDDTLAFPIFPSAGLEIALKKMDEVVQAGSNVLVNCAQGKSRSGSLVIAYLMARQGMTYDEALAACKRARPQVNPNANFERQLRQLEASLRSEMPTTSLPISPLETPPASISAQSEEIISEQSIEELISSNDAQKDEPPTPSHDSATQQRDNFEELEQQEVEQQEDEAEIPAEHSAPPCPVQFVASIQPSIVAVMPTAVAPAHRVEEVMNAHQYNTITSSVEMPMSDFGAGGEYYWNAWREQNVTASQFNGNSSYLTYDGMMMPASPMAYTPIVSQSLQNGFGSYTMNNTNATIARQSSNGQYQIIVPNAQPRQRSHSAIPVLNAQYVQQAQSPTTVQSPYTTTGLHFHQFSTPMSNVGGTMTRQSFVNQNPQSPQLSSQSNISRNITFHNPAYVSLAAAGQSGSPIRAAQLGQVRGVNGNGSFSNVTRRASVHDFGYGGRVCVPAGSGAGYGRPVYVAGTNRAM